MKRGLFIVFEGGEGSGKSTILEKIYNWLLEENKNVVKTREPGGIKISEQIREIILSSENEKMDGAVLRSSNGSQYISGIGR